MHSSPEERERWLVALKQPLRLAGTTLPNRLMMSALTLQYGAEGLLSDRHYAFYRERARGGVGLLFSEQMSASALDESPFAHALLAYAPGQIERFAELAAVLDPFGARFFVQLFSAGAAGAPALRLLGPSDVPAPGGQAPSPLALEEIEQLLDDYAKSAANVKAGGLHGIELHGAHGWLIGQFLSPYYNRRTDEYGGSIENRCRLALNLGRAVRASVGGEFPLGLALTYDEMLGDAGITPEDTLEQLRFLDAAHVFDFFDLSIGSSHMQHHTIASMAVPEGFALPFAARARSAIRPETAIFVAGRVVDPYMAGRAVAEGQADVVGMSRALLADPHLIAKAFAAERPEAVHSSLAVRTRCIGANHCVRLALEDRAVSCVLNPTTGREVEWGTPERARTPMSVTVIGAGPAGLRFGAIAAQREHRVKIFERSAAAGGHLCLLAALPTRSNWQLAIDDMVQAATAAGAQLHLDRNVTADDVLEQRPDCIVVAAGSRWIVPRALQTQRNRPPQLIAIDEAVERATRDEVFTFGSRVVIVDESGTYLPLGLADLLSARGASITLVTANSSFGHIAASELELPHILPRLERRGVVIIAAHEIESIGDVRLVLRSSDGVSNCIDKVDSIVFSTTRESPLELYEEFRRRHPDVRRIGDAASPRSTAAALHDGEALARAL